MRATERNAAPSVMQKAAIVLDVFGADSSALGVSELSRRSGLPKSTAHRMTGELVSLGWLERTEDGRLRLGLRLFELGQLVPRSRDLREAALPFMHDLREATGATVHLAVREGIEVVYVEILPGLGSGRVPSRVGGRLPTHATGVGKAILAFSAPEIVKARIDAGLPRRTPFTLAVPGVLGKELDRIRAAGISYDRQESAVGVVCAAAPVFGSGGVVVAGLSVTGMAERLDVERMAPAVRTAARSLSRTLGAPSSS